MQPDQCPTPRGRAAALALVSVFALAGASLFVGCSADEPPDPAKIRRNTLDARLGETFSATQARCIVSRIDDATVRALTGNSSTASATASLSTKATKDFDDAVVGCVTDPSSSTAPTTTPTPTTAVPAPSTSAATGN